MQVSLHPFLQQLRNLLNLFVVGLNQPLMHIEKVDMVLISYKKFIHVQRKEKKPKRLPEKKKQLGRGKRSKVFSFRVAFASARKQF